MPFPKNAADEFVVNHPDVPNGKLFGDPVCWNGISGQLTEIDGRWAIHPDTMSLASAIPVPYFGE